MKRWRGKKKRGGGDQAGEDFRKPAALRKVLPAGHRKTGDDEERESLEKDGKGKFGGEKLKFCS